MITGHAPFASGRAAELFEWGSGRVIKLWRSGGQVEAHREARIARAACEGGAATPKVIEVVEVDGRGGIVFERADGPTMVAALTTKPWTLISLAQQLAELQASLHRCPAPPGLESAPQAFESNIRRASGLSEAQKAAVTAILHALPAGDRLCHGDLHPDNVLMTRRGPMIVDWSNAFAGPPPADVARTAYLLRLSTLPPHMRLFQRLLISAFRAAFFHA